MDRIENMRTFLRVVDSGSFTAAAVITSASVAATSRAVSELEAHLHTRLLTRSTRRLAVTEAGSRYLARCRQILEDIDSAEAEASGAQDRPSGMLRMHSYASVGQHYVLPSIASYRKSYRDVSIELTLLQKAPDLFDGSADVAVVTAPQLPDSELISHHIGSTFSILCASPAYLESKGPPLVPEELAGRECLVLHTPGFPTDVWTLEGPAGRSELRVSGPVQTNVAESLLVAVRQNMGIASVPVYAAIDGLRTGALVRVLPEYTLQRINIYAIYASRRYVDAKIRTWIEFIRDYLPRAIAKDEATLKELTLSDEARGLLPS
ncbi:LysR family transcriptional regulator [Paraburkholderia fungorum]|jgi:DNA-binding transcriptional LysR family regulator|uniref:LysR family transcriptional regulator n=1 Tax=Paraburkholderia fungorum TaxID=134537 RepID=UPI0038B7CF14